MRSWPRRLHAFFGPRCYGGPWEKRRMRRKRPHASLTMEVDMAHYVMLVSFTDQGARGVKDTPKRAEVFKTMAEKSGVKIHNFLWTLGQPDVVVVVEAADDIAVTALSLSAIALGNVRTQTLKAFDAGQMREIVSRMV
jgi:uncharacterized protein with GYD domain